MLRNTLFKIKLNTKVDFKMASQKPSSESEPEHVINTKDRSDCKVAIGGTHLGNDAANLA